MAKPISIILLEFLERRRNLNHKHYHDFRPVLHLFRVHGFPKELDKTVIEILERLLEESRYGTYPVKKARQDLEELLRKYQTRNGGKNAVETIKR